MPKKLEDARSTLEAARIIVNGYGLSIGVAPTLEELELAKTEEDEIMQDKT